MIGVEDRLRARAAEIQDRMDAIDAKADAREGGDRGVHTNDESQEYVKLTTELEGLGRKMKAVEHARAARTAEWLGRRGLEKPGDFADGALPDFDDGARIDSLGDKVGQRPPKAIVGFTDDGKEVRILEPSERVSKGGDPEARRGQLGAWMQGSLTGDWTAFKRFAGTAQTGYSQTEGGVLLDSSGMLIDLARAKSRVIEAGARTIPMENREITIARVTSEPSGVWRGESKSVTPEKLLLDAATLKVRTRMVLVEVPNEVVEDTVFGARLVEDAMSAQLGLEMDRVALFGTGSAEEPLGLENHADIKTITAVGIPTNFDELSDAVQDVQESNGEASAVIFSPRTAGTLDRLKDTTGQPMQPPASFANLRKLPTTQIPNNRGGGSDESLAFVGDFSHLWIGIRLGIRIERSRHAGYAKNETHFRGVMRLDVIAVRPDHFVLLSGITV